MTHVFVTIHVEPSPRAVPLAAGMLSQVLKDAFPGKLRTVIENFFVSDPVEECVGKILAHDPDCVAFSVYVWNVSLVHGCAALLRTLRPDLILYAGGPEASADAESFTADGLFDFVIPGEGESLVVDAAAMLLEGAKTSTIRIAMEDRCVPDLSRLPSPYLSGTLDASNRTGVLWELSRGCPFSCHFCYESRGTRGVRTVPIGRIRKELELFAASGVEEIFVLDPTFNHDKNRAAELLALMKETAPDIRYFLEIRGEFLDRKTASLFSGLSCSLQIGLQSAHPEVLKNVGRTLDRESFRRKVLFLHEADVVYGFDLIYGLPGDTLSGFLESIDYALGMVPNHVDIFPLAVLPGTLLSENAPGFGLLHEDRPPYLVTSSPTWSAQDLRTAARVTGAFDLFYNMGKAVTWFPLVLSNLGMKASEVFILFAEWLHDHPYRDRMDGTETDTGSTGYAGARLRDSEAGTEGGRIPDSEEGWSGYAEGCRKAFLSERFLLQGKPGSALVASDLMTLFANAGNGERGEFEPDTCHFDPDDLLEHLENGVEDFEELAFFVRRRGAV